MLVWQGFRRFVSRNAVLAQVSGHMLFTKTKKALLILFHNQAKISIKLRKEINWLPHFSMLLWRSAGACTSM